MKRGPVHFSPVLLPQLDLSDYSNARQVLIEYGGESIKDLFMKRSVIAKKNLGRYFVEVYTALYGGEVNQEFRSSLFQSQNGTRKFSPDITRVDKNGINYTEVKGFSLYSGNCFINPGQLENYCYSFLQRVEEGDLAPSVNYAFFRYGRSHESPEIQKLTNQELMKTLSNKGVYNTHNLLIFPLNLMLFLISAPVYSIKNFNRGSSRRYGRDNRSWLLRTGHVSKFHKGLESIDGFLTSADSEEIKGLFMIDKLKVRKYKSPKKTYCGRYKVNPFEITEYYFEERDAAEWAKHFAETREKILRHVGIEDLSLVDDSNLEIEFYLDDRDEDELPF